MSETQKIKARLLAEKIAALPDEDKGLPIWFLDNYRFIRQFIDIIDFDDAQRERFSAFANELGNPAIQCLSILENEIHKSKTQCE